jgi:hypothetical protein
MSETELRKLKKAEYNKKYYNKKKAVTIEQNDPFVNKIYTFEQNDPIDDTPNMSIDELNSIIENYQKEQKKTPNLYQKEQKKTPNAQNASETMTTIKTTMIQTCIQQLIPMTIMMIPLIIRKTLMMREEPQQTQQTQQTPKQLMQSDTGLHTSSPLNHQFKSQLRN